MKFLALFISFFMLASPVSANEYAIEREIHNVSFLTDIEPAAGPQSFDYQTMNYDVYAGGFHAVEGKMTMDYRSKGLYGVFFEAQTHGLLGSLAPWKGSFKSEGWVLGRASLTPELHESISYWRDEKEVKSYNYSKNGTFKNLVTQYTHKKPKKKVPEKELTEDTIDVLTAMMMVMEDVADGKDCEGTHEVFDGKRRFKLIFKHQRFVMLRKTRYNVYAGPAAECTVEVEPVAGKWHEKPRGWMSIQEQGRDRNLLPTVWMAQVAENAVAVPVRVRVKTAYGTMFMHMTRYESGETVLELK